MRVELKYGHIFLTCESQIERYALEQTLKLRNDSGRKGELKPHKWDVDDLYAETVEIIPLLPLVFRSR